MAYNLFFFMLFSPFGLNGDRSKKPQHSVLEQQQHVYVEACHHRVTDSAFDFHAADPGSRPAGGGGDRVRYLFSEKRKIPRRKFLATLHFDIVVRN